MAGLATMLAVSAGCASQVTPPPVGPTSSPEPTEVSSSNQAIRAEDRQGPFQLVLELPRRSWRADEAIDGLATLALVDGVSVDLGGSGGGLIGGFDFVEVGGSRHIEAVWTSDCGPYRLTRDQPMTSPIKKSGGYSADQPDAAWYRSFLADPLVHLPPGDWTITAVASFVEGHGCRGATHLLRATIPVHVTP